MSDEHRLEEELKDLKKELDDFKKEKERVRAIVGQIGGVPTFNSKFVNIVFIVLVMTCLLISPFIEGALRFIVIDLAVGILSLKIIYLIYSLTRENHFILWILSSIEWQINDTRKDLRLIKKLYNDKE